MVAGRKEITKAQYDKAMAMGGNIVGTEFKVEVFGVSLVYGYDVFAKKVYKTEDGKYMVDYLRGSTCD